MVMMNFATAIIATVIVPTIEPCMPQTKQHPSFWDDKKLQNFRMKL